MVLSTFPFPFTWGNPIDWESVKHPLDDGNSGLCNRSEREKEVEEDGSGRGCSKSPLGAISTACN